MTARDFSELREAASDGRPHLCWVADVHAALDELESLRAKVKPAKPSGYTDDFEDALAAYPPRPGSSKAMAFKAWNARLAAGATTIEMIAGTRRYAAYCAAERTEPSYIKMPATFYGPGEHFSADWTVAKAAPSGRSGKFDPLAHVNQGRAQKGDDDAIIDINPRY